MNTGIYIHIPFCRQKCAYCDFPSYAGCEHLYQTYTTALCREIAGRGGMFSAMADTVYIGGGTPSLLSEQQLFEIVSCLRRYWNIADGAEFSMEANPGTVSLDRLAFLRSLGINRISFGVQSFNDRLLKKLGRIHTSKDALEAVIFAQRVGFDNINIDLMSGLPGQTASDWTETLSTAVASGVQHISAYGLKVEEGTPFFADWQRGHLALPSEEQDEVMYDWTADYLPRHGFLRYEISNYAVTGRECRHNLKYWNYHPYIGLGAGAHSFARGKRTANTPDVRQYIDQLKKHDMPIATEDCVENEDAMAEFIFLALRTTQGVDYANFAARFGVDFRRHFARPVAELSAKGLLHTGDKKAALTVKGMKFGNAAFMAFLPDNT